MQWNILDGGGDRLDAIGALVRKGNYDVVSMNELNGFNGDRFRLLAARWGYAHSALLHKSAYNLGVLSKHPLKVVVRERSDTFAHGLLCVQVVGVKICITHLHPHDIKQRLAEARSIAVHATGKGHFMLVGDLNTLSSLDRAAHRAAALPKTIRTGRFSAALKKKFLNARSGQIDYSPMQTLLNAGLYDVGVGSGNSVPTNINADHMHFAQLRLDYCLVNPQLLSACGATHRPRARLLRTNETTLLSDHFPLAITFGLRRKEASHGSRDQIIAG